MRTLVIHPDDRSTDFLRAVYENIEDKTVITGGVSQVDVDFQILNHERVIMLGHGTPNGLLSVGKFKNTDGYIIDAMSAEYLKRTKENIYIWCYASDFVKKYNLKGFASGMFISEVHEATMNGIYGQTKEAVDIQCEYFCNLVGAVVDRSSKEIYDFVSEEYGVMVDYCKMAKFNHERLYVN